MAPKRKRAGKESTDQAAAVSEEGALSKSKEDIIPSEEGSSATKLRKKD